MDSEIAHKISDLIIKDQDFKALSEKQDVYCPFEALGAVRSEIRHSNFLSNLINPNLPHGFGESMLRGFIETIFSENNVAEKLLEFHFLDLSNVMVLREWRHIDILIRIPRPHNARKDLIIVIEIKIEALEHGNQLENYEKVVRETWSHADHFFFFLTPNQTQPSRPIWRDIAFSSILSAMERVLRNGEGNTNARMMAEAYISMMRRRYVANEKMNELAVKIWSRHRAALEFLIDNQPNTVNELLQSIFDSNFIELVNTKLQSASLDLHLLSETKSARYLIFAVKEWDDFKGMIQKEGCSKSNRIFRLEIDFNKGGVRARWVVGPGPQNVRQSLIEAIEGNKTKFITKKFTSVASKSVVSKEGMDKLIEEGLADDDVKTVKGELVSYAIQTIDRFDTAFQESSLLIKNCN